MPAAAERRASRATEAHAPREAGAGAAAALDRISPLPLHFQVRTLLVGMIERGEVRPGRPLPPERALAAELGVSLAPVRQAILDLVREGALYRVRGKGTFLREQSLLEHDPILLSFSESMRAKGLDVRMQVLRKRTVAAGHELTEAFGSAGRVWAIERLALVEGEPVALVSSRLSARRFPGLGTAMGDHESLYHVIEARFGVVPMRVDSTVEVARCTTAESSLLGVPPGAPVLLASGTTFDADDVPVERFEVAYRADRIRLRLDSHRYAESVKARTPSTRGAREPAAGRASGSHRAVRRSPPH